MKKTILLLILTSLFFNSRAQEVLLGGNMADESAWKIIDLTGYGFDPVTITFDYSDDAPTDGNGGCLNISGAGVTRNFIYQKVTLTKGHTYYLSCAFKNASDESLQNYWLEINLVKNEPVLSGDGTAADFGATNADFQIGMHYWKNDVNGTDYSRMAADYDGLLEKTLNFAYLGVGANGDSIITNPRDPEFTGLHGDSIFFTLPDTVSTTDWYVLIKAGEFMTQGATEPVYNWMFDELTLWDMAQPLPEKPSSAHELKNQKEFDVYPNPITDGIVYIRSNTANEIIYSVHNTLGKLIKSGLASGSIDLTDLKNGLYILSLKNGTTTEQYKILIK